MKYLNPAFVPYIMLLCVICFYIYLDKSKKSIFHPISLIVFILVATIIIGSIVASDTFNLDNIGMWIQYILMDTGAAVIIWKNRHDE